MSSDEDSEVLLLLGGRHECRSINRKFFNVDMYQGRPIKDMAPAVTLGYAVGSETSAVRPGSYHTESELPFVSCVTILCVT